MRTATLVFICSSMCAADAPAGGVPGWLSWGFEERVRLESAGDDSFALNRLRFRVGVAPAEWLRVEAEAQDARAGSYGVKLAPAVVRDSLDLRQAYVEVGRTEDGPVGLRVGRQALTFGEGRLLGDPGWSNVGRTFDAVRLRLRRGRFGLDAFAASVVQVRDGEFDRRTGGNNLHGLYGSIASPVPRSTLEPYVLWRLARNGVGETGIAGRLNTKTVGVRWAGTLPWRLDYGVEIARQTGLWSTERVSAWAGHWGVGRTLSGSGGKPRLAGDYNFASGDRTPGDGRRGTFDPLYAAAHDKYGLADLFGWSNLQHARAGFEVRAPVSIVWKAGYNQFWLANARDGLYLAGRRIARAPGEGWPRHVGQEFDLQAAWNFTKTDQLALGYSRLLPGAFLARCGLGVQYNGIFVMAGKRF